MTREERIKVAISCKDSNSIPKVPEAGQIVQQERPYQIMHNGIKIYTDSHYGDFNIEIIQELKGVHEPQEEKVFYEVLKVMPEGASMLELGSFWAYYSAWFNHEVKNAKNYMVEPLEEVLNLGAQNFKLNGFTGDFTPGCIGDKSLESVDFIHWDDKNYKIPQWCVDDILQNKNINYLNMLHSDIQGAEFKMLQGAQKSFDKNMIGFVFISTHSEKIHFNCIDFLKTNNFNIISEHTLAESYATDGLIVAAHKSISFPKIHTSKRNNLASFKVRLNRLLGKYK